jgi:hypothetical protein
MMEDGIQAIKDAALVLGVSECTLRAGVRGGWLREHRAGRLLAVEINEARAVLNDRMSTRAKAASRAANRRERFNAAIAAAGGETEDQVLAVLVEANARLLPPEVSGAGAERWEQTAKLVGKVRQLLPLRPAGAAEAVPELGGYDLARVVVWVEIAMELQEIARQVAIERFEEKRSVRLSGSDQIERCNNNT